MEASGFLFLHTNREVYFHFLFCPIRNMLNQGTGSRLSVEDAKWLSWVTKQFLNIAGEDQQIELDEFKQALGVKKVAQSLISIINQLSHYND